MSNWTLLEAALDASSEGVLVLAVEDDGEIGLVEYVNRAFENGSGYGAAELLGQGIEFLRGLTSEPTVGNKIRHAIKSRSSASLDLDVKTKDHSMFHARMCISPVYDEHSCLKHLIFVCHDISELVNYKLEVEHRNRELAEANRLLQELVVHDPMTGLYNRRFFDAELERMLAFHQRRGMLINLAFFDVDYFNRYNDHYGHLEGDRALKIVAAEIQRNFARAGDIVSRYGGEEFVVLSSADADTDVFINHVEAVRKGVEALALPHAASAVAEVVTVSAGVFSRVPKKNCTPASLVEAADHGMYIAKKKGRNRVEMVPELKVVNSG